MTDVARIVDGAIAAVADLDLAVSEEAKGAPSHYLAAHRHEYVRTVRDILAARPPAPGPVRVLEIGAFFGAVCIALARLGYQVTAGDIPDYIELPEQVARYAKDGIATKGIRLEELVLPFADESFDVVVMCEVLEHINFNPLPLLKEINRVLAPGGLFYLSLPNYAQVKNRIAVLRGGSAGVPVHSFFDQLDPKAAEIANGHWREYTMPEVRAMLEPLGFRIDRHYFFSAGETQAGRSLRKRLGRLFYRTFPSLKENQTVLAVRERRTEIPFAIPSTVHADLRAL